MNRTMRGALTTAVGGLLIVGSASMSAQADEISLSDTTMSVTLDHTRVYPGTTVVLTATVDPATNPDGGTIRVDVNGKSRSSVVAGSRASVTLPALPIGTHNVKAHLRAEGQSEDAASARTVVTVVSARRVALGINAGRNASFASGEKFWLRGQVRSTSNRPLARQKVTLYSYVGSHRSVLAQLMSDVNGRISYAMRPSATTQFRATSGSLVSPLITATRTTTPRTLAQRALELGSILGAPQTEEVATGATTYRRYARGMLVQTRSRTWLVRGEIQKEYVRRNAVLGDLGVPASDERCGLMEDACLQRFKHGAAYTNVHAKDRTTSAIAPGAYAELVATALSQLGYREPHPRKSKYSKWIHRTGIADAWCGYFASWVSVASGHGSAVVKSKSFAGMLAAERKRGRMTHTPIVGRLAYLGYFKSGAASHVGIVVKFTAKHVWTIEGNVSASGGMKHPRGVHFAKHNRAKVVFYAKPRW